MEKNNYDFIKDVYGELDMLEHFRESYNAMNICGLRAYYDPDNTPGIYNDCIMVVWIDEYGNKRSEEFLASTDPGLITYKDAVNKSGVACLVDGNLYWYYLSERTSTYYNRSTRKFAQMRYPCMRHYAMSVPVTRDTNFDGEQDSQISSDGRGILIHYGGEKTDYVGKWSQGCQVIPSLDKYERFIQLMSINKTTILELGLAKEVPYLLVDVRKLEILDQHDDEIFLTDEPMKHSMLTGDLYPKSMRTSFLS